MGILGDTIGKYPTSVAWRGKWFNLPIYFFAVLHKTRCRNIEILKQVQDDTCLVKPPSQRYFLVVDLTLLIKLNVH